jgi:diguanylate cyclase (GGDEF)-like protein
MRLRDIGHEWSARVSLTRQVAILSLIPIVALGLVLSWVLQGQIQTRALDEATQSARLIARVGIKPNLTPSDLSRGLTPAGVSTLDRQLTGPSVKSVLARIKIWSPHDTVIYSDDHSLIGRRLPPSDDLESALAGHPRGAAVVNPTPYSETAGEVGLGTLVEVYVPLRFRGAGPPAGAFEMYLSYAPIAATLSKDKETIAILVAVGLALLWAILYRIVARASRRLARQAKENYRLARHDPLTGLPNRTKFIEGVGEALTEGSAAVLLIDLDGFKEINNTLGNANGDRVLVEVGRRLGRALGPETLLARLGADEFAVLCRDGDGEAGAVALARSLHAGLESPVVIAEVALNVDASIGIAVADAGSHAHALLQQADAALAWARSCSSLVEVYSPERDRVDPGRLVLLGQVRAALERREFVLYYQPELDLRSGRVTAVEALVRWRHPERGLLSPDKFVPLIEPTALVGPLALYVVEEALRQWGAWRRLGVDVGISVNLSARNLLDRELPAQVQELLRRYGVPAGRLTVEVTESAAMTDPGRAVRTLQELRDAGVGVSVDDFGTGNASIEYLAALPAQELKIDRSLIATILRDARDEAIVRSTIDLARNLGLRVVAEGIETAEVLERVESLGCDAAQGYLISRPAPAEELTASLAEAFGVGAAQVPDGALVASPPQS